MDQPSYGLRIEVRVATATNPVFLIRSLKFKKYWPKLGPPACPTNSTQPTAQFYKEHDKKEKELNFN